MVSEKKPMTLAQKLAKIGKEIGAVGKSGTNKEQKYTYIEYSVVAGKIRELFDTYSIIIVPKVKSYQVDSVTSKYGSAGYHYVLNMEFNLVNGEDLSDYMTTTWLGESTDFGDKGINKAETSGTKYFLMRLFNISEKGEEEADSVSPEFANSAPVYTVGEIKAAKETLQDAESLEDLKIRFVRLGKIRTLDEIVKFKDELKKKFIGNDVNAQVADAKEQLAEHFNK